MTKAKINDLMDHKTIYRCMHKKGRFDCEALFDFIEDVIDKEDLMWETDNDGADYETKLYDLLTTFKRVWREEEERRDDSL